MKDTEQTNKEIRELKFLGMSLDIKLQEVRMDPILQRNWAEVYSFCEISNLRFLTGFENCPLCYISFSYFLKCDH